MIDNKLNFTGTIGKDTPRLASKQWFNLRIDVSLDSTDVRVFMDDVEQGSFQRQLPARGSAGIIVANGYANIAYARPGDFIFNV